MAYLTETQIDMMAEEAVVSFEMTASWARAAVAAKECATDDFDIVPNNTAVLLAVKRARLMWEGARLSVKKAIDA